MRILKIFALIIGGLYLSSYSQEKKNDLYRTNLKGIIKSCKLTIFTGDVKFGEFQKKSILTMKVSLYSDKGLLIGLNEYNSDGSLKLKGTLKRDVKNNVIEENKYKPDGSLSLKIIYKYDSKGNNIQYNYNSDGSLKLKCANTFNTNGKTTQMIVYNSDGLLQQKFIYKYDSLGNNIEYNNYTEEGYLMDKVTYKYDNKGNRIESDNSDKKWNIEYEFDKTGNWIKQRTFVNDIITDYCEREIVYY